MSVIESIFDTVVSRFDADKMAGFNANVVFDLTGDNGKTYHLTIADGKCTYGQGSVADPDASLTMATEDFEALSSGSLNPMMAFMQGKIKVDGDMSTVMKLQTILTG